jgi:hypothetical protein
MPLLSKEEIGELQAHPAWAAALEVILLEIELLSERDIGYMRPNYGDGVDEGHAQVRRQVEQQLQAARQARNHPGIVEAKSDRAHPSWAAALIWLRGEVAKLPPPIDIDTYAPYSSGYASAIYDINEEIIEKELESLKSSAS